VKTQSALRVILATAVALAGFIGGYSAARNSGIERALKAQVAQLQATIDILQANAAAAGDHENEPGSTSDAESPLRSAPGKREAVTQTNPGPNEVTEQDIELSLKMNERSSNGEYILSFERPTDRKFMQASVDDLVARMSSNNAPAINQLFSNLGLPKDTGERFRFHQTKIQQASLQAEMAIQQLLEARKDYDERIRATLSEEQYARYLDFETSRSAEREYKELENYTARMGVSMDSRYKDQVQGLIRQSQAYTDRSWHGPYDGLPEPAIGTEMVANQLQQQIAEISKASSSLKAKALDGGLPGDFVETLEAYYSNRIEGKKRVLDRVLNSEPPPAPLTAGR
jgi:hypothetical protein